MLEKTDTKLQVDERQFLNASVSTDTQVTLATASLSRSAKSSLTSVMQVAVRYQHISAMRAIRYDIAEESARGTAFLFVPVWLGLGAILYFGASFEPSALVLTMLSLTLLTLRFAVRRNRPFHLVATVILLIAFGAGCAKLQSWRNSTPMLAGEIATDVSARIISINQTTKSHRAILEILETTNPNLKYAPHKVRVTLRQGPEQLTAGQIIKVRLRLMPPSGPVRPTSYDFAFQSYFDGIGASGFSIGPVTRLNSAATSYYDHALALLEQLRQTIAGRIRAVVTGTEGEVAVALIAGVQAGIDEPTMESLRITGLAHILSISGLHMALVAGLFMVVLRMGFALFPNQASRFPVKKYAAALALLASFFYLLLSGSDVAALRSFIMLAVFLLAIVLDQQALTMRNLALSAIAILIVTPHEIMGPSFQMSFAATAALISAYAYWTLVKGHKNTPKTDTLVWRLWSKTWRFAGALSMTSVIAGTATSLFSAWHFHRLAPMGLPANLAAMPAVSLIVMPSAVASALAMPFGAEEWPLRAMGEGIKLMLAVSNYFAGASPAGISGSLNIAPFMLATCALLCICILQTRLKWVALLPMPALVLMLWQPSRPVILISEDANLVAVRVSNDTLAVNRDRPNAFTIQAWQKAQQAANLAMPMTERDASQSNAFICNDQNCTIKFADGTNITWIGYPAPPRYKPKEVALVKSEAPQAIAVAPPLFIDRAATEAILAAKFTVAVAEACGNTDILIIAGPSSNYDCKDNRTFIVSAHDLALYGSAEVYFDNDIKLMQHVYAPKPETNITPPKSLPLDSKQAEFEIQHPRFTINYAIGTPNRPWNFERKFSRAARNIPPFQPIPKAKLDQ